MAEPSDVVVEGGGRESAADWFRRICDVHDRVFSAEPFVWVPEMSPAHEEELRSLMTVAGFRLAVARQRDRLLGYAYGHPLPVDHGWWGDFDRPLPAGRVLVLGVLDNLVKGAAGQAIQAFNVVFGLPEEAGLEQLPLAP